MIQQRNTAGGNIVFKWVAGLCAAIYVTLLVFGEPQDSEQIAVTTETIITEETAPAEPAEIVTRAPQEPVEAITLVETIKTAALDTATDTLRSQVGASDETATEIVTAAAAVMQQVATPEETSTPVWEPELETVLAAAEDRGIGEIWRVTGSTVNLRAGANTQSAILGRTQRGDSAEVIELLDNGWARVFILENGQEAYMSAKFLQRGG